MTILKLNEKNDASHYGVALSAYEILEVNASSKRQSKGNAKRNRSISRNKFELNTPQAGASVFKLPKNRLKKTP
jgi:transketolase N-terminal domain/subunit